MSKLSEAEAAAESGFGYEDLVVKFGVTEKQARAIVFGQHHGSQPLQRRTSKAAYEQAAHGNVRPS